MTTNFSVRCKFSKFNPTYIQINNPHIANTIQTPPQYRLEPTQNNEDPLHNLVIHPSEPPSEYIELEQVAVSLISDPKGNPNSSFKPNVIYALVKTKINQVPINIMIDTGSASSHATKSIIQQMGCTERQRRNPLQVIGFGNKKASLITKYSTLTLLGIEGRKATIDFNIFEKEFIADLPGVDSQIFDEFPHLLDHKNSLTAPIPREAQRVDAIIGVRDVVKIYAFKIKPYNNRCLGTCVMIRADGQDSAIEARETIFGTLVMGGLRSRIEDDESSIENDKLEKPAPQKQPNSKNVLEIINGQEEAFLNREIPLDLLLKKFFENNMDEETSKMDKSALQRKAYSDFLNNHRLIPLGNNQFRFQIKLTRLPKYLYPERVDGRKISSNAINRFYALERRLHHNRNKELKKGVFDRIEALLNDGMLVKVGPWEEHKAAFLKDQIMGKEQIVLPWQTVIDSKKVSEPVSYTHLTLPTILLV